MSFAVELQRRVKEQLERMGGVEYSKANLSLIDRQTAEETFVTCEELGSAQMIPEGLLSPGVLFTVGFDGGENRFSLYCIQINAIPGGHRFNVVGTSGKGIKESTRMASSSNNLRRSEGCLA
jgi:predicted ATP-dependent Lon-type protease